MVFMVELSEIPRRKRRYYRDQNIKLIKHLSKQVNKAEGIKEIEKQKIILGLKRQLERARKEEIKQLAAHLFEQASYGKDDTKDLVFKEVLKYQGKELSNKEADEIAGSIYSQLRERQESLKAFEKLEERERKEAEKLKRKMAKGRELPKKEEEPSIGAFGAEEPERVGIEPKKEVEKIKDELSMELGLGEQKEDSTFKELEKLSSEAEKPQPKKEKPKKDEFSLEGFTTDFELKKKKKKGEQTI